MRTIIRNRTTIIDQQEFSEFYCQERAHEALHENGRFEDLSSEKQRVYLHIVGYRLIFEALLNKDENVRKGAIHAIEWLTKKDAKPIWGKGRRIPKKHKRIK